MELAKSRPDGHIFRFLSLPTELQLEILSYLHAQHDLRALRHLGATCHQLSSMVEPYLFEILDIKFTNEDTIFSTYASLIEKIDPITLRRLNRVRQIVCRTQRHRPDYESEDATVASGCFRKVTEIPIVLETLNRNHSDWRIMVSIKSIMINATIICLLDRLKPGQLKGFSWNMDMGGLRDITWSPYVIKRLQADHPNITTLMARMRKSCKSQFNQLVKFNSLQKLDLIIEYFTSVHHRVFDILYANQDISHFGYGFQGLPWAVQSTMLKNFEVWKKQNPGRKISLKKLTSVSVRTNPEILIVFKDLHFLDHRHIRKLQLHCYTFRRDLRFQNIFFRTLMTPFHDRWEKMGKEDLHFPNLTSLKILITSHSTFHGQGESIAVLVKYLALLSGLEELVLKGLRIKFDLDCMTSHANSLRIFHLGFDMPLNAPYYTPKEVEDWKYGFNQLRDFSITSNGEIYED